MTPTLFDAHTHTQFAAFGEDQDAVIRRALDAGVWMVNVGTQRDTSAAAVAGAARYPEGVYATVGLHPVHTEQSYHDAQELGEAQSPASSLFAYSRELGTNEGDKNQQRSGFMSRGEEFDYEYYKKLAQDPKVVAIGECGLDYYRIKNQESGVKQERAFRAQIQLAQELHKPLMIHCRNAFSDLIAVLASCFLIRDSRSPGIVHFFTGTKDDAKALLDLGFSFSFGGVITFARDYDEVVRYLPLERIITETDAPYVAPARIRGTRNEPTSVVDVVEAIAQIRGEDMEAVRTAVVANARRLFAI